MTLIKLKDDNVTSVLPLYSSSYSEPQYFDDYYMGASYDESFSVQIEFEKSEYFSYHSDSCVIDESNVSDCIKYLFLDSSKFSELTAEEFKENLKKYLDSL